MHCDNFRSLFKCRKGLDIDTVFQLIDPFVVEYLYLSFGKVIDKKKAL